MDRLICYVCGKRWCFVLRKQRTSVVSSQQKHECQQRGNDDVPDEGMCVLCRLKDTEGLEGAVDQVVDPNANVNEPIEEKEPEEAQSDDASEQTDTEESVNSANTTKTQNTPARKGPKAKQATISTHVMTPTKARKIVESMTTFERKYTEPIDGLRQFRMSMSRTDVTKVLQTFVECFDVDDDDSSLVLIYCKQDNVKVRHCCSPSIYWPG